MTSARALAARAAVRAIGPGGRRPGPPARRCAPNAAPRARACGGPRLADACARYGPWTRHRRGDDTPGSPRRVVPRTSRAPGQMRQHRRVTQAAADPQGPPSWPSAWPAAPADRVRNCGSARARRRRRAERGRAVHRVRHPGLPRADRPGPAGRAHDLPGVHRRRRGPAAVLGAQPPRLAAHRPGRAQPRPPGRGRAGTARPARRDHHPERRRAAPGRGRAATCIELHGSLSRVVCLGCGERTRAGRARPAAARREPGLGRGRRSRSTRTATRCWTTGRYRAFQVVDCLRCAGALKPDVIFFGENVPPARVDAVLRAGQRGAGPAGPRLLAAP